MAYLSRRNNDNKMVNYRNTNWLVDAKTKIGPTQEAI